MFSKYLRTGGRGRRRRRRGRHRRLDVVRLEVALEVQDLELILLRQRQQAAERRIGLDDLLLHQRVRLGVRTDTGGDLRAGERRALCDAEERTESVRDGRRLREYRVLLGGGLRTLYGGGTAAATLLGTLELARDLLLELLHVREDGTERRTEHVDLLDKAVELANDVDVLRNGRSRLSNDRGGDGGGDNGRSDNGSHNGGDNRGRNGGDNGGGDSGGGLLGGGLLRRGRGAHVAYIKVRGTF